MLTNYDNIFRKNLPNFASCCKQTTVAYEYFFSERDLYLGVGISGE